MKALAGWMAALMLLAAPMAFGDELPPGVEIQRVEEPQTQQAAPAQEEVQEESQAPAPAASAPQSQPQQEVQPQSPQTGDPSLLALAGLGVSALVLAVTRKGAMAPGRESHS